MDFDFIVVGAGLSGLCLSRLILRSELAHKSLLLIDGAADAEALRTLSFWDDRPSVFEDVVRRSWSSLTLPDAPEPSHSHPLSAYRYRTLFFADAQRAVLSEVRAAPGCQVLEGRVSSVETQGDHGCVQVGEQRFRGRWVFDSRFQLASLRIDLRRFHLLRQHFTGWLLRTSQPAFQPDQVTLFDFRQGGEPGTSFFYLLPLSPHEAVVDLVSLSPVSAAPLLDRYLRTLCKLSDYEIVAREHGISPLTEQPFVAWSSPRVRRIGIAAGRIKPSTGYALSRIEADCRAIVHSLQRNSHPGAAPPSRPLYRFADSVLLELWQHTPAQIPALFAQLFHRNSADRVLAFLDERLRFLPLLALIWSLPSAPFLRALFRWLWRRCTPKGAEKAG